MNAPDKQFHADRLTGLGGSDLGAILGLNPWRTPFQVYQEKIGAAEPFEGNLQTRFGSYAEQFVAEEYTRVTGRQVQRYTPMLRHPTAPLIGHVDRLVIPEGAKRASHRQEIRTDRGLEAKTASAFAAGRSTEWGESGTDQIPESYLVQTAAYMALTGCSTWDLAVLFGNQEFRVYTIARDLELEAMLIDESSRWWRDHVEAVMPPDPHSEIEARQRWASHRPGAWIDLDEDGVGDLRALARVKAEICALEAQEQAIKDRLLPRFADAEIVRYQGETIATYKSNKPSQVTDWKKLANSLLGDFDDLSRAARLEPFTTEKPGARTLRLKLTETDQ